MPHAYQGSSKSACDQTEAEVGKTDLIDIRDLILGPAPAAERTFQQRQVVLRTHQPAMVRAQVAARKQLRLRTSVCKVISLNIQALRKVKDLGREVLGLPAILPHRLTVDHRIL